MQLALGPKTHYYATDIKYSVDVPGLRKHLGIFSGFQKPPASMHQGWEGFLKNNSKSYKYSHISGSKLSRKT